MIMSFPLSSIVLFYSYFLFFSFRGREFIYFMLEIYYSMFTGYLCKQVLKKYKSCPVCEEAVRFKSSCGSSESQLVQMKSRSGLIHANLHFFNLIRHIEASFAKYSSRVDVFDVTLDEVLDTYTFTFPCKKHASEILSYAIVYYLRLRMRQYAHQENLKLKKKFVVKKNCPS